MTWQGMGLGLSLSFAGLPAAGGGVVATAPVFRSVSHLSYGSRTNSDVPAPAGVTVNDVLIAIFTKAGNPAAPTPPAGWTLVVQAPQLTDGSLTGDNWIYRKAADVGEPASYIWTHAAASTEVTIVAISGGTPANPIGVAPSFQAENSAANRDATAPSVTTTSNNALVLFYTQDWGDTALVLDPPANAAITWTARLTAPSGVLQYLATGVMPTAGPTGSYSHATNSTFAHPRLGSLIAIR